MPTTANHTGGQKARQALPGFHPMQCEKACALQDVPAEGGCMNTRTAALVFAIVFALVGLAGFVPSPPPPDAPPLTMEHGHGLALGMFPVNTLHNIVHLLFAALGFLAWSGGWSRRYFQLL